MPVTQQIDNLLDGVSQAAPVRREPSQGTEQINMLSHRERGLRTRPPSEHKAKVSADGETGSDLDIYDAAFPFFIDRSDDEKYLMLVLDGDLKVYNRETGAELSVIFPFGKDYLDDAAGAGFRAVTVGDSIVVLNRGITTAKDTAQKAPDALPQALVVVRSSDFGTAYTVVINDISVTYRTPVSTVASAESAKSTDTIAASLLSLLNTQFGAAFTFTQYGSTVHVIRQDSGPFSLAVSDGIGGTALLGIKDAVQSFSDLPKRAKDGMVVRVQGAPESTADDYYVRYDDSVGGVWVEVVKPGALIAVDEVTMPHTLTFGGEILSSIDAQRQPITPSTRIGGATDTWLDGYTERNPTTGILDPLVDHTIDQHSFALECQPAGTDGTLRAITLMFDLDTTNIDPSESVLVYAEADTGPATSFVAHMFNVYGTGSVITNETLSFTTSLATGAKVRLRMEYGSGSTPGPTQLATLTAHGKNNTGGSGVVLQAGAGREIVFNTEEIYPHAMTVRATIDGIDIVHVIGTIFVGGVPVLVNDETGEQVATELARLIDLHATYTATSPSAGVVLVKDVVTGALPGISVALEGFDPETTFWNPDLALVDDEHIGRVIKNLTDGSEGTILANTVTQVIAVLSGGSDNTFSAGDLCSIVGTGTYFVFGTAPWAERGAGDDTSAPFPSFIGKPIDEAYFYQNRLGFTSRETIFMSSSGSSFSIFRKTATDLLASDPIDVKSAVRRVPQYHSALPWKDGLYLFTKSGVVQRVSGEPALSPQSVRIDDLGEHPSDSTTRPLVTGERLFIATAKNEYTRVAGAALTTTAEGKDALVTQDITKHVASYLRGNPLAFGGDAESETLVILTDHLDGLDERRVLYVCSYHFEQDAPQLSWSKWQFAGGTTVLSIDIINGVVWLIVKRNDGVFLETITLDPQQFFPGLLGDGSGYGDGGYNGSGLIL